PTRLHRATPATRRCRSRGVPRTGLAPRTGRSCLEVFGLAAEPALDVPVRELRVAVEHARRQRARPVEQHEVGAQVGEAQERRARLSCAEEFARAADLEVAPRDLEAIAGLDHRAQTRTRSLPDADTLVGRTPQ